MKMTIVDVDKAWLWNGAKVLNLRSKQIREIFVIPDGKTISECVKDGSFDLNKNVDLDTVLLNKSRFQLINEED